MPPARTLPAPHPAPQAGLPVAQQRPAPAARSLGFVVQPAKRSVEPARKKRGRDDKSSGSEDEKKEHKRARGEADPEARKGRGTGRLARGAAKLGDLQKNARALLDAYREAFRKKHQRETKEKVENVTSGVAVFYESDEDEEDLVATPQRVYQAMRGKAEELGISEIVPRSDIPNIHSEMIALYQLFERRSKSVVPHTHLRVIGVSKEICFLCQVMLTLFGVDYEKTFTSTSLYPGWKDPTGYRRRSDGKGLATPRTMLAELGMDVAAAAKRLSALVPDQALIDSILDGGLQGPNLKATIKQLMALDENLTLGAGEKAPAKRKAGKGTKAGRRLARQLAAARRAARAEGVPKGGKKKPGKKKARGHYDPTAAQITALGGRRVVRITPDGDCLYAALIRLGAFAGSVQAFRRRIALSVRLNLIDLSGFAFDLQRVATDIARPGSYDNLGGDVAPSLIARVLGITILVYNEDGGTTTLNGGTGGTYRLVRVTHPLPHFHAAA